MSLFFYFNNQFVLLNTFEFANSPRLTMEDVVAIMSMHPHPFTHNTGVKHHKTFNIAYVTESFYYFF